MPPCFIKLLADKMEKKKSCRVNTSQAIFCFFEGHSLTCAYGVLEPNGEAVQVRVDDGLVCRNLHITLPSYACACACIHPVWCVCTTFFKYVYLILLLWSFQQNHISWLPKLFILTVLRKIFSTHVSRIGLLFLQIRPSVRRQAN